jgi:hypothetical protein
MSQFQINAAMQAKLAQAGIPHESVKVFGVIRQNVHVVCLGRDTADKWAQLLNGVFRGAKVSVLSHTWNAVENKGTQMLPTKRNGWLVAVAG